MFDTKIDVKKNRLYITLGVMEPGEPQQAADAIISDIDKMRKGFTIINDISQLKIVDEADQAHILRAQEHALKAGVSRVVRVVGASMLAQLQMDRKSKEAGYKADFFKSIEDAEKALDEA